MRKLFFVSLITVILQFSVFAQTDEFQKGLDFAKKNDFQNALVKFQNSFSKNLSDKKIAQVHYNIGVCFYRLNQMNQAVTEFDKVINLNPNNEKVYYALAMTQVDLKDFDQAETNFLKAINLDETNGEIWFDFALVLYQKQKFDESIVAFQNSIKYKSVAKSTSYNNLGVIYALQGDFESAKKQLEIAVKKNVPEAQTNLEILKQVSANKDKNLVAKLIIRGKNNE
ncbi:MAG: tetratricopeptide repeat protein [Pyrinomonadaceae bacterium]|nr:tetratricopeptide repeat protein [Pyrinomonadaceae bacterium]